MHWGKTLQSQFLVKTVGLNGPESRCAIQGEIAVHQCSAMVGQNHVFVFLSNIIAQCILMLSIKL
jgi:hypothetical protein